MKRLLVLAALAWAIAAPAHAAVLSIGPGPCSGTVADTGVLTITGCFLPSSSITDLQTMAATDLSNALRTGSIPSVTSCGSGAAIAAGSTDFSGTISVGSGTVTACTLTFAATHSPRLRCWTTPALPIADGGVPTTTAYPITFASSMGGSTFDYGCQ